MKFVMTIFGVVLAFSSAKAGNVSCVITGTNYKSNYDSVRGTLTYSQLGSAPTVYDKVSFERGTNPDHIDLRRKGKTLVTIYIDQKDAVSAAEGYPFEADDHLTKNGVYCSQDLVETQSK